MKNLLIPTQVTDVHAQAIDVVLSQYNINVIRWYITDFPSQQIQTFSLNEFEHEYSIETKNCKFSLSEIDMVWFRRPRNPHLKLDKKHPDYNYLKLENEHFTNNAWKQVNPNAIWVNPIKSAWDAGNKLYQLVVAKSVGLNIPTTLSTNDTEQIKCFIKSHQFDPGVIYKSYSGLMEWTENDKTYRQNAIKVFLKDLPSELMLRNSSGIYQKAIKKRYELRVFFFGEQFVVCKINPSSDLHGAMDWRAIPKKELSIEPYSLPISIQSKIVKFMGKMSLITGSLDLIVDENGEYIFLEVNESGQFLWMELENPEIKVLGPFCNFLGKQLIGNDFELDENVLAKNLFGSSRFEQQFEQDKLCHIEA